MRLKVQSAPARIRSRSSPRRAYRERCSRSSLQCGARLAPAAGPRRSISGLARSRNDLARTTLRETRGRPVSRSMKADVTSRSARKSFEIGSFSALGSTFGVLLAAPCFSPAPALSLSPWEPSQERLGERPRKRDPVRVIARLGVGFDSSSPRPRVARAVRRARVARTSRHDADVVHGWSGFQIACPAPPRADRASGVNSSSAGTPRASARCPRRVAR